VFVSLIDDDSDAANNAKLNKLTLFAPIISSIVSIRDQTRLFLTALVST